LLSALKTEGLALSGRELAGESETFIRATVRGTDLVLHIHEHEARFHRAGKLARRYDCREIVSPLQLQKEFVQGVVEAAKDCQPTVTAEPAAPR